jgi:hypothetical protein
MGTSGFSSDVMLSENDTFKSISFIDDDDTSIFGVRRRFEDTKKNGKAEVLGRRVQGE